MRRADWGRFGRFHMMRGGKRSDSTFSLLEKNPLEMDNQPSWLPATGDTRHMNKRSGAGWNEFLRQLRSNAGIHRGEKVSVNSKI